MLFKRWRKRTMWVPRRGDPWWLDRCECGHKCEDHARFVGGCLICTCGAFHR